MRRNDSRRTPLLPELRRTAVSQWVRQLASGALILVLIGFLQAPTAEAAEVLQVRSSSLLQVGDRNRSVLVELHCLQVDASLEEEAANWLREALPRGTRVNLRPRGTRDGRLRADVIRLADYRDMAAALADSGLASVGCPGVG